MSITCENLTPLMIRLWGYEKEYNLTEKKDIEVIVS